MSYLESNKNWEGLAERDMLWSILTDPSKRNSGWTIQDFFESGETEVDYIFDYLAKCEFHPDKYEKALDFGCGAGRISRALSKYFNFTTGIDVSEKMIEAATTLNADLKDKLDFKINADPELNQFKNNYFDLIFSVIVLQHIPPDFSKTFIRSFLSKLKSGGLLIFQIPTKDIRNLTVIQKIKSKVRIRERLAMLGIGKGFHMHMHPVSFEEIKSIIENNSGEILDVQFTNQTDPAYNGDVQFISKEECYDYYSQLFIVRKK